MRTGSLLTSVAASGLRGKSLQFLERALYSLDPGRAGAIAL